MFNTRLALKLAVCRNPVTTIVGVLSMFLCTQTYLLRIADGPAYQVKSQQYAGYSQHSEQYA